MSGATVSSNKKLADGTLISIGGVGASEFLDNASILLGDAGVDALQAEIKAAFTGQSTPAVTPAQAVQNVQAAFPQAQPVSAAPAVSSGSGNAPLCPSHERPATWREGGIAKSTGNPYDGFWKCATTGNGIHLRNGSRKRSCD